MKYLIKGARNKIVQDILKRIPALLICVAFFSVYLTPFLSHAADQQPKVVRVGWYEESYCYTDKFGRRTGMAYDFQQRVATYTGWTYEYVDGTWPELMEMLKSGEIDLLSDVSFTPERAQSILYPSIPMGSEGYYIYVSPDHSELMVDDPTVFEGKTFAVNKGSVQEQYLKEWVKLSEININIMEITDLGAAETIDLLTKGIIDAFVSLDIYVKRPECVPVARIGESDYYLAVSKKRPDLLVELEHALRSIQNVDPFYSEALYQKYVWSADSGISFSQDDTIWLSHHSTIKVGYKDDYQPFCYLEDGNFSGALKEYLEQASGCVGGITIDFEPIPYETMAEALCDLQKGEIDVVFPVNMSAYESELNGLFLTTPFMKSEVYALVRRGAAKDIFNSDTTRVVLAEGNFNYETFIKDYYPDWEIHHVPGTEEAFNAIENGKADCALTTGYRLNTNDRLRRRYDLSILDTGEDINFSFAVKRENKELFAVLNKIVGLIPESAVDAMLSKYNNTVARVSFSDYLKDNWEVVLVVAVSLALIIILLLTGFVRSDRKANARQKLIAATEHDPLTGLYARNFFFEYAIQMFSENPSRQLDAIVMNIEQFHVVNALYGWDFGDSVLKALGKEISKFIADSNSIACRSQADRFNIYCEHTEDYQQIFDRFQRVIDDSAQNINIRLRMGVMPGQEGIDPVQLFDRARAACNMSRGGQHSRLIVFNEEMREREILEQRLMNDLKQGVENKEFLVYYQPKYNVQVNPPRLESAEALVRWNHHELGMIPPNDFVTVFEKNGQIGILDRYVWKEVVRQMAQWRDEYGKIIPISVNLSRVDVLDPNIETTIDDLVDLSGIGRENLHLEITESAYTEGEDHLLAVVNSFRQKGYHIEMDDFGTGYSSLNMLTHMAVDILKLDRSFVKDLENDVEGKNVRLIELILDIAKSLKMSVVAEGVETKEQLDFLKERGCDLIQGYYFSKPLPKEEFEKKAFQNQ